MTFLQYFMAEKWMFYYIYLYLFPHWLYILCLFSWNYLKWYPKKHKKCGRTDGQRDEQTDGQTDGRTDRVITIGHPQMFCRPYNYVIFAKSLLNKLQHSYCWHKAEYVKVWCECFPYFYLINNISVQHYCLSNGMALFWKWSVYLFR